MSEAGRRVRVCDDAVFMVFARRAEGQAAGHPFFGSLLWSEQRNERKNSSLKLSVPVLWARKERKIILSDGWDKGNIDELRLRECTLPHEFYF
jgi:hypothetical protein